MIAYIIIFCFFSLLGLAALFWAALEECKPSKDQDKNDRL